MAALDHQFNHQTHHRPLDFSREASANGQVTADSDLVICNDFPAACEIERLSGGPIRAAHYWPTWEFFTTIVVEFRQMPHTQALDAKCITSKRQPMLSQVPAAYGVRAQW